MAGDQRNPAFPRLSTARPLRYAITPSLPPGGAAAATLLAACGAWAQTGLELIQLRLPGWPAAALYELCRAARATLAGTATRLLLNDRLDVALAAGLHGLHLPSRGLPAGAARRMAPPGFLLARSCHSVADVAVAASEGCDFCVLGPIFPTPSKEPFGPPLGLPLLQRAAQLPIAVLALGGVGHEQISSCLQAGAAGVAGIRIFHPSI